MDKVNELARAILQLKWSCNTPILSRAHVNGLTKYYICICGDILSDIRLEIMIMALLTSHCKTKYLTLYQNIYPAIYFEYGYPLNDIRYQCSFFELL